MPVHSVTYHDGDNIHVEVYDRHDDALARHDAIAATGARVLVQPHMLTMGNQQRCPGSDKMAPGRIGDPMRMCPKCRRLQRCTIDGRLKPHYVPGSQLPPRP
jgi:hypothetical protein